MSAARQMISRTLRTAFAAAALLVVSACTVEVAVPTPEEIPDPGFTGDWIAPILGTDMILRIGEFQGIAAPAGRLLWRDIDWGFNCSLDRTAEPIALNCVVVPTVAGATCSLPDGNEPTIEIARAVPNSRIEANVRGDLRPGNGAPCEGESIVNWDAAGDVTFLPR